MRDFVADLEVMKVKLESLDELRVFVQVVHSGGFTAAGLVLGRETNVVSRLVARLEARLGTQLLVRTTRRVATTHEGRLFLAHAERLLRSADEAEQALRQSVGTVEGVMRVAVRTTTTQFGFVQDLVGLLQTHPRLSIQLLVSDSEPDLVGERIDVAVRIGDLPDSSCLSRPLGTVRFVPVAAPAYFESRERPATPADLAGHECVLALRARPQTHWPLVGPRGRFVEAPVSGRFACSDVRAQADAVYAGLGIGLRPAGEVREAVAAGTLERVLPGWSLAPLAVHGLLPPGHAPNARSEAVLALLKDAVKRVG